MLWRVYNVWLIWHGFIDIEANYNWLWRHLNVLVFLRRFILTYISGMFWSVKVPTIDTKYFRFEMHRPAFFISCRRSYFHHKLCTQPSKHERLSFKRSSVIQKYQAILVVRIHGNFDNRLRGADRKRCIQLPVWRALPLWTGISLGTGFVAVSRRDPSGQSFVEADNYHQEKHDTISRTSISEDIVSYTVYSNERRYCPGGVACDIVPTTTVLHVCLFRSSSRQWSRSGQCNG